MNARGWIARVRAAAKGLAARLRRQPRPAMVGIPPSARKIPAIPADPAEHAVQFAHTWAGRLEHHVEGRMHALDIPEHQVGAKFPRFAVPADTFRLQLVRHASGKARSRAGIVSGAAPHTTSADGNGAALLAVAEPQPAAEKIHRRPTGDVLMPIRRVRPGRQ